MSRLQYTNLGMTHSEIVDYVNEQMGFVVDKQKAINVIDHKNEIKEHIDFQAIGIKPMKPITDVKIY